MKIFALHDAGPAGYNIGRTLGEATDRMPHHSVDVIDLGLTVDTAIGLGLEPEEFVRDRALASTILPKLSDVAVEWFTGRVSWLKANSEPDRWIGQRVELNAFTTAAS